MTKRRALFNAPCSVCLTPIRLRSAAVDQQDVIEARAKAAYKTTRNRIERDRRLAMERCAALYRGAANVRQKDSNAARKNDLADARRRHPQRVRDESRAGGGALAPCSIGWAGAVRAPAGALGAAGGAHV